MLSGAALAPPAAPFRDSVAPRRLGDASSEVVCRQCQLPLRRRQVRSCVDGRSFLFCCYGCALAHQITAAEGEQGAAATLLVRLGLAVFFSMNVMMLSMPTYAAYVYGEAGGADGPLFSALRYLSLVFTLPVLLLLGGPILQTAARGLRAGVAATEALIVLGASASVGLSAYHTVYANGGVYFETACALLVFVTLGRYLEARARADATDVVRRTLIAPAINFVRLAGAQRHAVRREDIEVDDVLLVNPGDVFPTDGVVAAGTGGVDESLLTGESRPVVKDVGSRVAGGTSSLDGSFHIRVTARAEHSAAARIVRMLEEAARARGAFERMADRVGALFVPFAICVATASGLWWGSLRSADAGVLTFLAVLAVACPCALGLATPVAVWTGLAVAARRGVVIRNADVIERLSKVRRVFFDKTGTLTERAMTLVRIRVVDRSLDQASALAWAAALEADLVHPIAAAIIAAACRQGGNRGDAPVADARRVLPGRGVEGIVDGRRLSLLSRARIPPAARAALGAIGDDSLATVVVLCRDDDPIAVFELGEQCRPEAATVVAALRSRRVAVELLSGDHQAASVVPGIFAVDEARLGLLPEQKLARLQSARGAGTMMIGDGLNDGPALAAADVGVAVGSATDVTRMSADIAILGDSLLAIPWLLEHSQRVRRIIRQNLAWAFGYNGVALAIAACGQLNPVIASLAMLLSSVAVVANTRRLRPRRPGPALAAVGSVA